ncbi:MAG: cyclopropane-fatty-acyl-phospholipid synthase [Chloroflexota bacterium]|nr:cyclopropane-fatty-acyl-phospholipid synthase [Chloroflexota bacterium]MDE2947413.1 cyclopropane-fatty-acyl-phospholipid synthase [Chloroflexota bacterium]
MVEAQVMTRDSHVANTLDLLTAVFENYPGRDFAIRLWDGTVWEPQNASTARFTIVLNGPSALRRMFFPPTERKLGEAYMFGDFEIEGELYAAIDLARFLWEGWSWSETLRFAPKLLRLPSRDPGGNSQIAHLSGEKHSVKRDMQAIQYHYDVSNEFYQLWLDEKMVYSCAYFKDPAEGIDAAQSRKLDYICRKLRLEPGDRLLDIGCGWGALIMHAAENYGVDALGITLSEKQLALAEERIEAAGLSGRCRAELLDYRNVDESQPFDKIVSVGMVEHVGRENLAIYFEKAYRLLRHGGVFLNHGITLFQAPKIPQYQAKDSFVQQYIFPDGDSQHIAYVLDVAAKAGFEVRDVESLREHYALTLKNWLARYEAHEETILDMLGPVGYRRWRIYLTGARWVFESGYNSIHQALLYKTEDGKGASGFLPLNRDDWYVGSSDS